MSRPEWAAPDQPYLRLSYSTLEAMNVCERKYQLDKLLVNGAEQEDSEHFSFGHAFGAGIASYMTYGDMDIALLEAWLGYWPILETERKNEALCYTLLMRAQPLMDTIREEWEVPEFNGEPACELSFRIDIDDTYYYVGYIDVVLRSKLTGKYAVLEVKSTGLQLIDLAPLYKNSNQAIGYSIALDAIAGEKQADYKVQYLVGQIGRDPFGESTRVHHMPFTKTLLDRLNWFMTLGMDVERLHTMAKANVYPRRGGNCVQYNRPCRHFGVCGIHDADKPKVIEPDETEYTLHYKLDDIVADHLKRINEAA